MQPAPSPGRRRRGERATVYDVAARAGVSPASVSRYLNVPESLAEATALRIAQAIKDTGYQYRPNQAARSDTAESRQIPRLIMLATLGERSAKDISSYSVFAPLFAGFQRRIKEIQGNLVNQHCGTSDELLLQRLDEVKPEAVLLLVSDHVRQLSAPLFERLRQIPTTWVLREHCDPSFRLDRVFYNNDLVGRMAAEHLISTGARTLAFINTRADHHAYRRRRVDFVATAREANIPVQALEVGLNGIGSIGEALLRLKDEMPDAIFLPSDDQVVAAHHILISLGFSPGTQVRLMGCNNDASELDRIDPRPATIDLNLNKLGWRAIEQLITRFNHPDEPTMLLQVSPSVVVA